MKASMTFIQSNGWTEIDLILKQKWRRFIWRQVSFKALDKDVQGKQQAKIKEYRNHIMIIMYFNAVTHIVYTIVYKSYLTTENFTTWKVPPWGRRGLSREYVLRIPSVS